MAARGRRARRGPLVVHVLLAGDGPSDATADVPGARAGVVVGKRIGTAVARNLVKRRVRELLRSRLAELPAGSLIVVRALPGAADVSFAALGRCLDLALDQALGKASGAVDREGRPAARSR